MGIPPDIWTVTSWKDDGILNKSILQVEKMGDEAFLHICDEICAERGLFLQTTYGSRNERDEYFFNQFEMEKSFPPDL